MKIYCLKCKAKTKTTGEVQVKNRLLGKCAKCNSKKSTFIKRNYDNKQKGEGVRESVEVVKDIYANGISKTLEQMPKSVNNVLAKHGNKTITSITICREPIIKLFDKALNILSLGQWEKNKEKLAYDNVYHLYMLIVIKKN